MSKTRKISDEVSKDYRLTYKCPLSRSMLKCRGILKVCQRMRCKMPFPGSYNVICKLIFILIATILCFLFQ